MGGVIKQCRFLRSGQLTVVEQILNVLGEILVVAFLLLFEDIDLFDAVVDQALAVRFAEGRGAFAVEHKGLVNTRTKIEVEEGFAVEAKRSDRYRDIVHAPVLYGLRCFFSRWTHRCFSLSPSNGLAFTQLRL